MDENSHKNKEQREKKQKKNSWGAFFLNIYKTTFFAA